MDNQLPRSIQRLRSHLSEENNHSKESEIYEEEVEFSRDSDRSRRRKADEFVVSEDEINGLDDKEET